MSKLKIELFRYETLVFGKVLEMDEDLRGTGILSENEIFEISSYAYPALNSTALNVQGKEEDNDNMLFYHYYHSESEAIKVCDNICVLMDVINSDKDETPNGIIQII